MACSTVLNDEDISRFRTKPCRRIASEAGCSFGLDRCQYSHSLLWLRRCPFFLSDFSNLRYVPLLCPDLDEDLNCPRKAVCPFAHTEEEIRYHPLNYKTRMCAKFQQGECRSYYCTDAHTTAELRRPPTYNLPYTRGADIPEIPKVRITEKPQRPRGGAAAAKGASPQLQRNGSHVKLSSEDPRTEQARLTAPDQALPISTPTFPVPMSLGPSAPLAATAHLSSRPAPEDHLYSPFTMHNIPTSPYQMDVFGSSMISPIPTVNPAFSGGRHPSAFSDLTPTNARPTPKDGRQSHWNSGFPTSAGGDSAFPSRASLLSQEDPLLYCSPFHLLPPPASPMGITSAGGLSASSMRPLETPVPVGRFPTASLSRSGEDGMQRTSPPSGWSSGLPRSASFATETDSESPTASLTRTVDLLELSAKALTDFKASLTRGPESVAAQDLPDAERVKKLLISTRDLQQSVLNLLG